MQLTDHGGADFEMPEAGTYSAICYRIIDIGTQTSTFEGKENSARKLVISFELDEKMADGQPFVVGGFFTASLNEKANLRKMITSWRGRDFTEEELAGFDPKKMLGAPCMVSISLNKNGKMKITGVSKLAKGMPSLKNHNPLAFLSLEPLEFNEDVYQALSDGMKALINKSPEYAARNNKLTKDEPHHHEVEDNPFTDDAGSFDDIPF